MDRRRTVRFDARTVVMFVIATGSATAACTVTSSPPGGSPAGQSSQWVGTWATSPQQGGGQWFVDTTLRQVVHLSIGGDTLRVRLSNEYGTTPLVIGAARVALALAGGAVKPGTDRALTFGGSSTVSVPPGAPVVSDPVLLHAPPLSDLAVSMWLPDSTAAATAHVTAMATTYMSTAGNHTEDMTISTDTTTQRWYFLTGVSVTAPDDAAAVVTLGNSITDGWRSTVDANARWPDVLAARLRAGPGTEHVAVLDEGISGNRLLHDGLGTNALARFDRDVLAQPGARWVVVLEAINDIGWSEIKGHETEAVSADEIIGAQRQLIVRAHQAGLKIYGATLTPFERAGKPAPKLEAKRDAVNEWIRTSGEFDAVIDFDKAIRDPAHPTRLLALYDSGDHLHPSDAGYEAMGDAVDLRLFSDSSGRGGTGGR